jgi:hypothetical protein
MDPSIVLQTVDLAVLPSQVLVLVIAAVILAVAFLAIYWGYNVVSDAVDQRKVASAQALVAAAKSDLQSDFKTVTDLIRFSREQEFLLKTETGNMGVSLSAQKPQ